MTNLMEKIFFNCGQIREFLYDYMDGKLTFMTRLRFEAHLIMCEPCKQYFELYKAAANPRGFADSHPIPDDLTQKTLSFLENEGILNKGGSEKV